MNRNLIIAVNADCADIFTGFSEENLDLFLPVDHKSFIGSDEIVEFIVTITPHMLTALATYLVAYVQNSKKEIKIKKGALEIELKNIDITPEMAMDLLVSLEQKPKRK